MCVMGPASCTSVFTTLTCYCFFNAVATAAPDAAVDCVIVLGKLHKYLFDTHFTFV